MSDRYTRVFSLPENLYVVGSPIVIAAGTLLKDNQTGKIVAQLKLKSISTKTIKAVKVKLDLLDTAGNPLAESVEHDYLDLNVSRDAEFGQKNPVMVPNSKARSYNASVAEVVFADRSVWTADGENWEQLRKPSRLIFPDYELQRQYEIKFGGGSVYEASAEKDVWYCTCGALNHAEEDCHICHHSLFELQTLDMVELVAAKDARLAEEARVEAERAKQIAEEQAAREAAAEATKKKTAKILKIVIPVACLVIAFVILLNSVIIPNSKYNKAVNLMDAGQYEEAIAAFEAMDGYKDSVAQITKCEDAIIAAEQARIEAQMAAKFAHAEELLAAGDYDGAIAIFESLADYEGRAEGIAAAEEGKLAVAYHAAERLAESGETAKAAIAFGKLGDYSDAHIRSWELWSECAVRETISAGEHHTVGLCNDGTVVAVGSHYDDRCDTDKWKDIIAVKAGSFHTIGLHSDGTVVAVGNRGAGRCNTSQWTNIVAVDAGKYHTLGLRTDGTVVAVGFNENGQCNTDNWEDIVAVSGGGWHTVGLRSDGTVVAVGENGYGQCDTDSWRDIVAISAGSYHTVGLRSDGTVVAVGTDVKENYAESRCDTDNWRDIVAISAGASHTVGLRRNGTVVAVGPDKYKQCDTDNWSDIIAITTKGWHTIGLYSDGSTVTIGFNESGQCDIQHWDNIKLPN